MTDIAKAPSPLWVKSLIKATFTCLIFWFFITFDHYYLIRENVEDPAFDMINKWSLSTQEEYTHSSKANRVTVFAFDNNYMKDAGLFDKNSNVANYGYTFPREHIALFLDRLDAKVEELRELSPNFCPKALFIDFDLSFPTGANNTLSLGDKHLLQSLGNKNRCYNLLIVQNSTYNYVKDHANNDIKALISKGDKGEKGGIFFVHPYFHMSADGANIIRRYEPTKIIGGQSYISTTIMLWKMSKTDNIKLDVNEIKTQFPNPVKNSQKKKANVNRNIIFFKKYKEKQHAATNSGAEKSYWGELKKYPISLKDDFSPPSLKDTIVMLGGTDKSRFGRNDYHNVLNFMGVEEMAGIDIHANILMTLFYLGQESTEKNQAPTLKELELIKSLPIIFITFFLIDYLITYGLQRKGMDYESLHFLLLLLINSSVLYCISLYFLHSEESLWFNWLIIWILYQAVEGFAMVGKYAPRLIKIAALKLLMLLKFVLLTCVNYFNGIKQ